MSIFAYPHYYVNMHSGFCVSFFLFWLRIFLNPCSNLRSTDEKIRCYYYYYILCCFLLILCVSLSLSLLLCYFYLYIHFYVSKFLFASVASLYTRMYLQWCLCVSYTHVYLNVHVVSAIFFFVFFFFLYRLYSSTFFDQYRLSITESFYSNWYYLLRRD